MRPPTIGPSVEVPAQHCPKCGHDLDRAAGVGTDDRPDVGDVTVCIACTEVLVYAECMRVEVAPPDVFSSLSREMKSHLTFIVGAATLVKRYPDA